MTKHRITAEEYAAVKETARKNQNKRIDRRLQVIILRYEGKKDVEIADKLGYAPKRITQICRQFTEEGLEKFAVNKYGGNHRSLSDDEENEILEMFAKRAENGEIINGQDIKRAFDEKRGKDTGRGYIYEVLKRHEWRQVVPRSKHPKKASDEEIASSKKLTKNTEN